MAIPIIRPTIKRADMDSVLTCMVSDSLGPGLLGRQLVKDVSEYLGCAGGIALREYSRAIKLALDALGLERGARVILSPLAPRLYMDALREKGLEAVYCDVDEDSGCLSPEGVRARLEEGAAGIVVHSNLGFVPDMDGFAEYGIPLIEDISQAVGAHTGSRKLGACGNYAIIAMEPDGIITAGGGVLLVCRSRRESLALSKLTDTLLPEALLPDFNAALGITQIKNIEKFIERRKEIAADFSHAAMRARHRMLAQKGEAENVFFSFPLLLESGMKDVQAYARKKGIETTGAFEESVIAYLPEGGQRYPVARSFLLRCLLFPLSPSLTKPSVEQISKILSTLP
jgi:dTDP-4-amino-4,6-dideoxygalactose transaminase